MRFQLFSDNVLKRAVCAGGKVIHQHIIFFLVKSGEIFRGKYLYRKLSAFLFKIGYFKLSALLCDIVPIKIIPLDLAVNIAVQKRTYARTAAVIMLPFVGCDIDIEILVRKMIVVIAALVLFQQALDIGIISVKKLCMKLCEKSVCSSKFSTGGFI